MNSQMFEKMNMRQGFSLAGVLIALAIISVSAVIVVNFSHYSIRLYKSVKFKNERNLTAQTILDSLDCNATLDPLPVCNGATDIFPKDSSGNVLVGVNQWKIRTRCDIYGVYFHVVWKNEGIPSPIDDKPQTYKPLFMAGARLCANLTTGNKVLRYQTKTMEMSTPCFAVGRGTAYTWAASDTCPPGYLALSGGVKCGEISSSVSSHPHANQQGWTGACCRGSDETFTPILTTTCVMNE